MKHITKKYQRQQASPYPGGVSRNQAPSRQTPSRQTPSRQTPSRQAPSRQAPSRQTLTGRIAGPEYASVRRIMNEHPSEGLDLVSLAAILKDGEQKDPKRYLAFAEDMEEKEPQYLSTLGTRKRAVSQLEITVERADESHQADVQARFVEDFLSRDSLEDELFDMLDAVGKAFSLTEIVWETSENQWMPKRLHWIDPTWLEFDELDLTTPYIKSPEGPMPLAPYKFIPFTLRAKSGIPMRSGLARAIAFVWMFKNYDIKNWAQFLETYGQPVRIGRFGTGATVAERKELLRTIASIGRDFAGILPMGMNVEFVEASGKGTSGALFEAKAAYLDKQISKVVLGQTMTTDDGSSQAQATVHNEVREDIERSDARQLAAALNQNLVRPMIELNFGQQKKYPRLRIGRAEHIDLKEFTSSAKTLHALGLPLSKNQLYSTTGLTPPETDEDTLAKAQGPEEEQPQKEQPEKEQLDQEGTETASMILARGGRDGLSDNDPDSLPDSLEGLLEAGLGAAGSAFDREYLAPVQALADEVSDFDAFIERLPDLMAGAEPETVELMTQVFFMARAGGLTGLDGEDESDEGGPEEGNTPKEGSSHDA